MTDLEKKAEEWFRDNVGVLDSYYLYPSNNEELIKQAYKDGYEQGQKDFDKDVTKLLNSYGVKFIDTNSIGGLIALHQLMLDIEKENEELKAKYDELNDFSNSQCVNLLKAIAKMKNCENCKWYSSNGCNYCGNIENCEDYKYWSLK